MYNQKVGRSQKVSQAPIKRRERLLVLPCSTINHYRHADFILVCLPGSIAFIQPLLR